MFLAHILDVPGFREHGEIVGGRKEVGNPVKSPSYSVFTPMQVRPKNY